VVGKKSNQPRANYPNPLGTSKEEKIVGGVGSGVSPWQICLRGGGSPEESNGGMGGFIGRPIEEGGGIRFLWEKKCAKISKRIAEDPAWRGKENLSEEHQENEEYEKKEP